MLNVISVYNYFSAGRILNMGRNYQKVGEHSERINKSMVWLEQYGMEFGDKMPDSKNVNLPSSITKHEIFERMAAEMKEQGDEPCSKDAFFKNWKKDFPHYVIPKVRLIALLKRYTEKFLFQLLPMCCVTKWEQYCYDVPVWCSYTQQNSSCSHCAVTGQWRCGDYPLTY